LYKVYKSMEVVLGDKKELKFDDVNIIKTQESNITETTDDNIENDIDMDKIIEEKRQEIIAEAERQSQEILAEAEQQKNLIIEQAYNERENVLQEAKNEGYDEGFKIGQQDGYDRYQQLIDEAKAIKQEAYDLEKKLVKKLEKDIIELIIYSVKKILNVELDDNHELLLNLVEKGLEKATFKDKLIIRVSESDFDILNEHKNRIYMMTEGIDDIVVKKDSALKKGSVIIETESGKIDSSIDTQIKQIKSLFHDLFERED